MKIKQRIVYSGRVQGVGFRYSVKQTAAGFDVTGWVRNLPDGTVEMLALAAPEELDAFVAAVASSHLRGYIKDVRRETVEPGGPAPAGFEIRH